MNKYISPKSVELNMKVINTGNKETKNSQTLQAYRWVILVPSKSLSPPEVKLVSAYLKHECQRSIPQFGHINILQELLLFL